MVETDDDIYFRYGFDRYLIRKQIFKLLGGAFHIYGPDGQFLFYSRQKAFKLKEDIRLYTGKDMQTEALTIRARKVMDFAVAYDVFDPILDEVAGALQRRGFKSLFRDEWVVLDSDQREIGLITEDHAALALARRFLTNLIPQSYHAVIGDDCVANYKQSFNPFVLNLTLDFSMDSQKLLDRRLAIAAAVLLCAIEGRQN